MPQPISDELLIARLFDLPAAERAALWERACAADPALRARHPEFTDFVSAARGAPPTPAPQLQPPTTAVAKLSADAMAGILGSALGAADQETSGVRIAHYKLLQKIGEGGFGVVWMAEQQQPIRRRVALKIIKIGMETEEVIARFEAERQALALMEHPNIARVFDAGATDFGRPYFAMELVRGVAITRYCDENKLSASARLRLFVTVCQAVQHAHQKGVIHRDLKPSNILVTLHDGVPVPKVIDFGIAKATSARLTEKTLFTQFHAFIGTPAYTSPEQMEMSGLDIDTRSDIYSLGVLLYELLTGHPPFDSEKLVKSGLEAMRRTLREIDPPRPSARLNTLTAENRTSIAEHRSTDAGKLSLLLRGDLDWIAMRCLEKDRTRRYDSATALATDIERHLADTPVEARPPSRVYQAKKFVRRHKLAVAAVAAVALSLVAGLITSSTLLVSERVTRLRAEVAERQETALRQQADSAREREAKRVSRNSLILANHLLDDGKTTDALAYLVHAARKDPGNAIIAPRLASILATRNFLVPQAAPYQGGSPVLAVRFARDGRSFFAGTEDGTFRVFDAASGELKREIKLGRRVVQGGWSFARNDDTACTVRFENNTLGVLLIESGQLRGAPTMLDPQVWISSESLGLGAATGLSPDGRWLYARGPNGIWVWHAATGEKRLEIPLPGNLGGTDFTSDGKQLALVAGTFVQLWSLTEGGPATVTIPFQTDPQRTGQGTALRYSPDSLRLVLAASFAGLTVFDPATGEKLRSLPPWDDYVIGQTMEFAKNGRLFAAGNRSSGLWNLESGEFRKLPVGSGEHLEETTFDAVGGQLLTTSTDGFTRLWNVTTGAMAAEPTLQQNSKLCSAQSPDGRHVAIGTAAGGVHLFSVGQGLARPLIVPRSSTPTLFLPDRPARLLWMGTDLGRVLDAASGQWLGNGFQLPEPVLPNGANDFSPPIRADHKFVVVRNRQQHWQAWELGPEGVRHVARLEGAPSRDGIVIFSPRADVVAIAMAQSGAQLAEVGLWNLRTGARTAPSFTHDAGLVYLSANFSPDGRRLGVGTVDGGGILLDTATLRPWGTLETRALSPVYEVRFSPDGSRVVTTNTRHETQLWDAATRQAIGPVRLSLDALRARFSADGRWFATWGGRAVNLSDGHTGEAIGDTIPTSGKHVRFSPDGERVVTVGDEGNAQVWDIHTGLPITERMAIGPRRLVLAEFSPDGRFLRTEGGLTVAPNIPALGVWSVPPPLPKGAAAPEWLLQLATVFAHKTINEVEQCIEDSTAVKKIADLRRQIAALPSEAPLAEWGRWILNDRADRSIAPGFTITPAEADKLAAELKP